MAAAGMTLLGFGGAASILLAAPWHPAIPSWPARCRWPNRPRIPDQPDEDEAGFALASEAGLHDGLAFPFTYLALGVASAGAHT
jgi:hypothetical protein